MPKPIKPAPTPARDRLGIRVNLTLTPETVSIIDRLGAITGAGRATILREMIEEGAPQLAQMAIALEAAVARRPVDALKMLATAVDSLSEQTGQMSLDIKRTRRRAMRKKVKP